VLQHQLFLASYEGMKFPMNKIHGFNCQPLLLQKQDTLGNNLMQCSRRRDEKGFYQTAKQLAKMMHHKSLVTIRYSRYKQLHNINVLKTRL